MGRSSEYMEISENTDRDDQMDSPQPSTSSESHHLPPGRSHIQRCNSLTSSRLRRSFAATYPSSHSHGRCNLRRSTGKPKNRTITPPYPWSTDRRAVVHSLSYLKSNQILTITGQVRCRRCEREYEIEYDLLTKFDEIASFIAQKKDGLNANAPSSWTNPNLPTCKFCEQENGAAPVVPEKRKRINWLFLFLGQMLGCLRLDQLKYFCMYTDDHRTGAKNRLLCRAYHHLCSQLDPLEPLDHR